MDKITLKFRRNLHILWMAVIILFLAVASGFSQRSEYARLAFRNNQPETYVSTIALPGFQPNTVQLTAIFRLNYKLLSFKKLNKPGREADYYSTVSLNIELFKSPEKDLKYREQVSLVDLKSAGSARWQDTVYASNYKETTSGSKFAIGSMQVQLPGGYYTYVIQLSRNETTEKQTSNTRNIHVSSYENSNRGEIILVGDIDESTNPARLNLINRGNNVLYRNDFYAFIHLPDYEPGKPYSLRVNRLRIADEDTTQVEAMFQETLSEAQIYTGIIPAMDESGNELFLNLQNNADGYTYAMVKIPNHSFPNEAYKIEVIEKDNGTIIAQKVYHSLWEDVPTSLLNLDIAIDMLRFITDEQTIDRIDDGSYRDRKEKFLAFWEEKDPTPQTEFNELKAEYYRRIDYAYEHFSSQKTTGFNSDRGRIYIVYGPPNNIDRVYPTEGPTREIWTYNNRRFVFKATSGFGDFVLISN